MRKISSVVILVLCLFSCKNSNKQIVIKGDIEGLGNDVILVYGANNKGDALDTIHAENDKFEYKAKVDTFSQVTLLFKNFEECPIYIDKGDKVKVSGNVSSLDLLKVDGGEENDDMNTFKESITDLSKGVSDIKSQLYASYLSGNQKKYNSLVQSPLLLKTQIAVKSKAEAFIKSHPTSLASVYVLDRYFVQDKQLDRAKLLDLTTKMSGKLKDNPIVQNLVRSLSITASLGTGKLAPYISIPNSSKKMITLADFKNKYVLLYFWSTWSESSKKENSLIRGLYKRFKGNNLSALGVSLDVDKIEWKNALKKDSLVGEQVCDFNGWNNSTAIQYGVESLPTSVLIDPQGKIVAFGLQGIELTKKLEEVFRKDQNTK